VKKISVQEMSEGVKNIIQQSVSKKEVKDYGLSNESVLSETPEEATKRFEYENYMKTSKGSESEEFIENIGKQLIDDIFRKNL
jgi:hypothetical protein